MGKKAKLGKARKDRFYRLAKQSGYRARSAFKIIQLNRKYQFFSQCRVLVDLCAAPGGWLQAAAQHMPMSSVIVGIDLVPIKPIRNVITLQEDITTDKCKQSLQRELKTWKVDCFLNDGAPNVGSAWTHDAYTQASLTLSALKLACQFLRKDGWFVTKVFRSKDYQPLMWVFQQLFEKVHSTKPQASRAESAEIFVVCRGYRAPDHIDPKLLDPRHVFGELDVEGDSSATTFRQLQQNPMKRKAVEGYSEDRPLVYFECPVADFVLQDRHLDKLAAARALVFDKESQVFDRHPATTDEVRACCKDVQVLGKRELRLLLSWRKTLRQFMKEAGEGSDDDGKEDDRHDDQQEGDVPKTGESNVVEEQIAALKQQEEMELKKRRKQLKKKVIKSKEKLAVRLLSSEDNPSVEQPQGLFRLAHLKSAQQLSLAQDGGDGGAYQGSGSEGSNSEEGEEEEGEEEDNDSESILSEDEARLAELEDSAQPTSGDGDDGGGSDDDGGSVNTNDDDSDSDDDEDDDGNGGDSDDEMDVAPAPGDGESDEPNPLVVQFPEERAAASQSRQTSLWFGKEAFSGVEQEGDEDLELDAVLQRPVPAPTAAGGGGGGAGEKPSHSKASSVEVVPVGVDRKRSVSLDPEGLALGTAMRYSKKARESLIDGGFNRWTHVDSNLPDWFAEDEKKHCGKQLPVTRALRKEYSQRLKEINARPIKKVAAAKAKKKAKLLKKLQEAKQKAEHISDAADLSEAEKAQQLKALYRKANNAVRDKKKDKQYLVAKKGGKQLQAPRMKGPYKIVDARRKKDLRKKKSQQNNKGKKNHSGRRKR